MSSPLYLAEYGTYEEFMAVYDPVTMPFTATASGLGYLGKALANRDPVARLAIANRLLDDGADASLVSVDGDRINVLHVLWGTERERDVEGEAALIGRLLDGGADIDLRSPRFGLPLRRLVSEISTTTEYLRAAFVAVTEHSRPDLTAHFNSKREISVGQALARTMFGVISDEVLAYAAASGQDIDVVS